MPAVVSVNLRMQLFEFAQPVFVEVKSGFTLILFEQRFDLRQARADHIGDWQVHRFGQGLFQLADDQVLSCRNVAPVRLELSRNQPERRRFAGAVSTDQANSFAGFDRQVGVAQYHLVGEIEGHFVKAY